MCLANDHCELAHPADMTCGYAATLLKRGWSLVPTRALKGLERGSSITAEESAAIKAARRRQYKTKWQHYYRAKQKALRSVDDRGLDSASD